jgi:hypothetical protein
MLIEMSTDMMDSSQQHKTMFDKILGKEVHGHFNQVKMTLAEEYKYGYIR